VLGDAIARLLEASGDEVEREYYYNDAGRQMDLFALSVQARYLELAGRASEFPEEGYRGEYILEVAQAIRAEHGDAFADLPADERLQAVHDAGVKQMFAWIERTLDRFGVRFDTWFSERKLHDQHEIEAAVERLLASGHAYEADGAIWFRSTEYGDDKDRVMVRSNGVPTYFGADAAYVIDKFSRGFDRLIYVWGADHHGDVARVKGVAEALGYDPDAVELYIYQFVSFLRGGEPVKMSKRSGDLLTLDELLDEVGPDAARYTLLTRSHDSPIEFDILEVIKQSMENPVYYVQYAHARIASILRNASSKGVALEPVDGVDLSRLETEPELDLLRKIAELPEQVATAAGFRAPHRLTKYAEDLAATFHRFYTEARVLTDDAELTQARLWLATAAKQAVGNVLRLIGVGAPESMERVDQE
jgi:arginyl-tRNA synthetase